MRYYATSASQRASVTNSKTLYTAGFNVKGTTSNYNNYLPVGQLTRFYGTTKMVYVCGWAYDDDFVDRILSIYITIGGVKQSNSLIADTYCEECPTEGKYHGFSGYFWTEMVGEYEVCVYAKNVDEFGNETGTDTMLSSATMTILPEHTHQYEAVVIEPTCTEQGYTLHQCSCGDHYAILEAIAEINNYTHRLKKWKATAAEQRDESTAQENREAHQERLSPFAFSKCKLGVGEQVEFCCAGNEHSGEICTVADDKHVAYNGKTWTLTGLATVFIGKSSSAGVRGPQYFKYRGEWLTDLRRRMEGREE